MIIIRQGSTPKITCHIPEDIDMSMIDNVWLYLAQNIDGVNDTIVVDKKYSQEEVVIDPAEHTLSVKLTQKDSLALNCGVATIQIRLHYSNDDSNTSQEDRVRILPAYKKGEMTNEN